MHIWCRVVWGCVGTACVCLCSFSTLSASGLHTLPRQVSHGGEQPLVVGTGAICIALNSICVQLCEGGRVCKSTMSLWWALCTAASRSPDVAVSPCAPVFCVSERRACACWVCVRKRTGESRQGQGGRCTQRPWCSSKAKEIRFQESLELGLEGDRRWALLPAFPGRQHKAGLKNILPFRSLFIILN